METPICAAFSRSISTTISGLSNARSTSRKANLPDSSARLRMRSVTCNSVS